MKILMLYRVNINDPSNAGIVSKMQCQFKALSKGHEVDLVYLTKDAIIKNETKLSVLRHDWYSSKSRKFKTYYQTFYKCLSQTLRLNSYDLIYWRFHSCHHSLYKFFNVPIKKLVIELPSYPYEKEFTTWWQKIQLTLDKLYRNKVFSKASKIVHFGPHENIYNVPTIRLTNGIEIPESIKINNYGYSDTIRLIALGKWNYWHGLDRIIKGMANYNGDTKIRLSIIGEGHELSNYKNLVQSLSIGDSVTFYPSLTGKHLTQEIQSAHIGIGSLAHHRKGLYEVSALKHRTYAVYGLPFVFASQDTDFPKELSYYFQVAADNSDINLEALIEFYETLDQTVCENLSMYARQNLTWEDRMEKVLRLI